MNCVSVILSSQSHLTLLTKRGLVFFSQPEQQISRQQFSSVQCACVSYWWTQMVRSRIEFAQDLHAADVFYTRSVLSISEQGTPPVAYQPTCLSEKQCLRT